jgi:hypothetical protein
MRCFNRIPVYQNECSKAHHRGRAVVIEVSSSSPFLLGLLRALLTRLHTQMAVVRGLMSFTFGPVANLNRAEHLWSHAGVLGRLRFAQQPDGGAVASA